jgi:single-stranded-DNA-specific exonuclease
MSYKLLYENPSEPLITRLLKIRKVSDDSEMFLNPTRSSYRGDALLLNDCQIGINRIIKGMQQNEKMMIFGDYDVDGQTSSYIMYTFFHKFCNYKNVSVRLPHRVHDGYGIKVKHIEEIKNLGCSLIITVDNGITAIAEAIKAKELGIDLIITDHHQALNTLPDAFAIINPDISPDYPHRHICGAMVAFKVVLSIAKQL